MSDTTTAPDILSEYDLMELIAFASKVEREGYAYAAEEYAPRFEFADLEDIDDDTLRTVWRRHRQLVDPWWREHQDDGCDLHNAHIDRAQARRNERCLWGAGVEGRIMHRGTEEFARFIVRDSSSRCTQLLHRDQPGGEWTVVEEIATEGAQP